MIKNQFKFLKFPTNSYLLAFLTGITIHIASILCGCQFFNNNPDDNLYQLNEPQIIRPDSFSKLNSACNNWFDTFLKHTEFNGGMIVAKNGTVVFEKYQGQGHLNQNDTINENTSFHIASTSKTFTAMVVLKLWQDKKINIDDYLSKYFPDFNYTGVTIRSLLNHRSGLPNYVYFMDENGWNKKQFVTNKDVYQYLVTKKKYLKDIGSPNKNFKYCNTNYVLLALLIEKVTNIPFPEYLKKTIFDPLKMNHTFVYTSLDSIRTTPSYDSKGTKIPFMHLDKVFGDKNIFSTPRDILKWDRLLTSGQYLNKETLEAAYTPYSHEKDGIKNYGLGWRMYTFPDGYKLIFHNGWWHGNNSCFIRLPEENATIIVLGNRYNKNIYKAKYLVGLFSTKKKDIEDDE
jgi:CubicO group peptidase (beta-lactamase class C family)